MPVRVSISETGRFDGPESGSLWYVLFRKFILAEQSDQHDD